MNINILSQTAHWLVIDKPAGLQVEKDKLGHPSAEDWLLNVNNVPAGNSNHLIGIVHRLDRAVSGVLLVALRKSALRILNEQFRAKETQKVYWALVSHKPPKDEDTLSQWIKKDEKLHKSTIFDKANRSADPCKLHYKVLQRVRDYWLLEIKPETGKYHQIRAQMAHMGCPLVGDNLYGGVKIFAPNAIALHARSLTFKCPLENKMVTVEAEVPAYWKL